MSRLQAFDQSQGQKALPLSIRCNTSQASGCPLSLGFDPKPLLRITVIAIVGFNMDKRDRI